MPAIVHITYCVYILKGIQLAKNIQMYIQKVSTWLIQPQNCGLPPCSPFLSNNKDGYDLFDCFNFVGDDAEFW